MLKTHATHSGGDPSLNSVPTQAPSAHFSVIPFAKGAGPLFVGIAVRGAV